MIKEMKNVYINGILLQFVQQIIKTYASLRTLHSVAGILKVFYEIVTFNALLKCFECFFEFENLRQILLFRNGVVFFPIEPFPSDLETTDIRPNYLHVLLRFSIYLQPNFLSCRNEKRERKQNSYQMYFISEE